MIGWSDSLRLEMKQQKKNIGVIVRVPLASGLLTGKFSKQSTFTSGDHRNFNRNGEMFVCIVISWAIHTLLVYVIYIDRRYLQHVGQLFFNFCIYYCYYDDQ